MIRWRSLGRSCQKVLSEPCSDSVDHNEVFLCSAFRVVIILSGDVFFILLVWFRGFRLSLSTIHPDHLSLESNSCWSCHEFNHCTFVDPTTQLFKASSKGSDQFLTFTCLVVWSVCGSFRALPVLLTLCLLTSVSHDVPVILPHFLNVWTECLNNVCTYVYLHLYTLNMYVHMCIYVCRN